MSSEEAPYSMASTHSWISSPVQVAANMRFPRNMQDAKELMQAWPTGCFPWLTRDNCSIVLCALSKTSLLPLMPVALALRTGLCKKSVLFCMTIRASPVAHPRWAP